MVARLESLELVATLLDEQQLNSVGHLLLKTISLKKLAVVLAPSLTHLISDFATRICRNCSLECVDLVNSPAECLNLLLELTRSSKPKLQIVGQCVSTASKPQ